MPDLVTPEPHEVIGKGIVYEGDSSYIREYDERANAYILENNAMVPEDTINARFQYYDGDVEKTVRHNKTIIILGFLVSLIICNVNLTFDTEDNDK